METTTHRLLAAGIVAVLLSPAVTQANNGMLMTAYGAESAGMGGATLAVGGSVMDLQSNPANLARLKKGIFQAGSAFIVPSLNYKDSYLSPDPSSNYVNNVDSEKAVFPLPYVGYVAPLDEHSGWGIAFYAQGGVGAEFNGILRNTPGNSTLDQNFQALAGNPSLSIPGLGSTHMMRENTYSNFAFAKLTPGYARKFGPLAVGVGLDVGAGSLDWRWTFSDPFGMHTLPGAGYRYESRMALSLSGKMGVTYDVTENLTAAYSYTSMAKLPLDGKMSVNEGDPRYFRRAGVSASLSLPEQHFGGLAYKTGPFTLAAQIGYIKWSNVLRNQNFVLDAPWVATPFAGVNTNVMSFHTDWRDQPVYSAGLEYRTGSWALRTGYNYGPSASGGSGLNPIFPAVSSQHAYLGAGYKADSGTMFDFALEYAFPSKVDGATSSDWTTLHAFNGFGAGFRNPYYSYAVTMREVILHFGVKM
ncbi:MAG: outer membrane protein transport protein [Spirochaetia bacterium]|nr:outer membrane protein transport protein [Spirochaetia bacterium]